MVCAVRLSPRLARLDDDEFSKFRVEESLNCSGSSIAVLLIFFSSSKNDRLNEVGLFLLVWDTYSDAGSFFSSSMSTVYFGKLSRPRQSSLSDFFEEEEDEMLETRPSSVV